MTKSPFGLDQQEAEQVENKQKVESQQIELNNLYGKLFNSDTGKKVLDHLKKCTIDQPTWVPSAGNLDGIATEQFAFVREGQNSVVRTILDRVTSSTKIKTD